MYFEKTAWAVEEIAGVDVFHKGNWVATFKAKHDADAYVKFLEMKENPLRDDLCDEFQDEPSIESGEAMWFYILDKGWANDFLEGYFSAKDEKEGVTA